MLIIISKILIANNEYKIMYKGIHLGYIKNIETIKKGYMEGYTKNAMTIMLLGFKDKFILYDPKIKQMPQIKNIKYKKDKKQIIKILKSTIYGNYKTKFFLIKKNEEIKIKCDILKNKRKCFYKYYKNKKLKRDGVIVSKNKVLINFKENKSNISLSIIKNNL